MEPIISPWVFYLIDVSENIPVLFLISAFLYCAHLLITTEDIDEVKKSQWLVACLLVLAAMVAVVFVPSQDTIYKMIAASFMTPDNIDLTVKARDVLVNDAIEIINAIAAAAGK